MDRAVRQHPLGQLVDLGAIEQWPRPLGLQVVELVALLAADGEHVAKATRGDQGHARPFALDHEVAAERAAMDRPRQLRPEGSRSRHDLVQALQAGAGRVRVGGEPLSGVQPPLGVLKHKVCKRAAHVKRNLDR